MRLIAQTKKKKKFSKKKKNYKKVFLHQNFSRIMSVKWGFLNMDNPYHLWHVHFWIVQLNVGQLRGVTKLCKKWKNGVYARQTENSQNGERKAKKCWNWNFVAKRNLAGLNILYCLCTTCTLVNTQANTHTHTHTNTHTHKHTHTHTHTQRQILTHSFSNKLTHKMDAKLNVLNLKKYIIVLFNWQML